MIEVVLSMEELVSRFNEAYPYTGEQDYLS